MSKRRTGLCCKNLTDKLGRHKKSNAFLSTWKDCPLKGFQVTGRREAFSFLPLPLLCYLTLQTCMNSLSCMNLSLFFLTGTGQKQSPLLCCPNPWRSWSNYRLTLFIHKGSSQLSIRGSCLGRMRLKHCPGKSGTIKTPCPVRVFPVCSFWVDGTWWGEGGRTLFVLRFITLMKLRKWILCPSAS